MIRKVGGRQHPNLGRGARVASSRAFTLVELMNAVCIVGVLAVARATPLLWVFALAACGGAPARVPAAEGPVVARRAPELPPEQVARPTPSAREPARDVREAAQPAGAEAAVTLVDVASKCGRPAVSDDASTIVWSLCLEETLDLDGGPSAPVYNVIRRNGRSWSSSAAVRTLVATRGQAAWARWPKLLRDLSEARFTWLLGEFESNRRLGLSQEPAAVTDLVLEQGWSARVEFVRAAGTRITLSRAQARAATAWFPTRRAVEDGDRVTCFQEVLGFWYSPDFTLVLAELASTRFLACFGPGETFHVLHAPTR